MGAVAYTGVFEPGPVEWAGWALQLALIGWLLWRRPDSAPLPPLTLQICLLVVAAGWIWRLAYGFALVSNDFDYWIGDDPLRFLRAWEWSRAPFLGLAGDPWIAGSYYLHGSAMWLLGGEAIQASRFVSATYAVLPLIGVSLFAQAVFGRREVSALAAILVTPWWIQVLLETGLMTELPVTGLLLSGTACLLWGLRAAPGRRRLWLHVAGAGLLAAATAFHLVAWIYLAVIQLSLLLARCVGRRPARLGEWALSSAGAGVFCAFWLLVQWRVSGSPLAQFAYAGSEATPYKIAGSALENATIYPVSLLYSLRYLLPLVAFGVLAPFLRGHESARARAVLLGLAAALLVMVASAISGGTNVTPYRSVAPLATALAAYAAAALFPAGSSRRAASLWPRPALVAGALVVSLAFVDGHARIFEHRIVGTTMWTGREPHPVSGSLFALGRWLRREIPRRSAGADGIVPARVSSGGIGWSLFAHAVGEPSWLERVPRSRLTHDLRPGQLVVSGERSRLPLRQVAVIGPYHVYEAPGPAAARGAP